MSGFTLNNVTQPIKNALIPEEGPKCIPINCNFSTTQTISLSLQNIQSRNYVSIIQTIFVDNSLNSAPVYITTGVANQSIICPPQSQGYFPVLCPQPPSFVFTSTGAVNVPMQLINVPMPCAVWQISSAASAAINTVVTSGRAYTVDGIIGSNGTAYNVLRNTKLYTLTLNSSTTGGTLITGNPQFFVNGVILNASADYTTTAAMTMSFTDSATSTVLFKFLTPTAGQTVSIDLGQILSFSSGANSNLVLSSSVAISAGSIEVVARGGVTSQVTT